MERKVTRAICIDTREQRPLDFSAISGITSLGKLTTVTKTLSTGDYSLEGLEGSIAIERKSKADAWGCVGSSRRRFERCLQRLAALDRAAIVIECGFREFRQPPPDTRLSAKQAVRSYLSWSLKYRIPVFWAEGREEAARIVVILLASYLKHCTDNGKGEGHVNPNHVAPDALPADVEKSAE